ncbi:MAG: alkaline phosphatase D family protein [Anditalea sp.]
MKRRNAVKAIALSTVTPHILFGETNNLEASLVPFSLSQSRLFESSWHHWPDMLWTGPEFWGNRLQDWQIRDGKAVCIVSDKNRSLHCLTCQLTDKPEKFESSVNLEWLNQRGFGSPDNYVGFRIGAKGKVKDYRSAAVFGQGLDAGITATGQLFIGKNKSEEKVKVQDSLRMKLEAEHKAEQYILRLSIYDLETDKPLAEITANNVSNKEVVGNMALIAHFVNVEDSAEQPSVSFANWELKGGKISQHPAQTFGPICFAQYTLHDDVLKLNAQLTPIEAVDSQVSLQIKEKNSWETLQEGSVDPLGRVVQFRIEEWGFKKPVSYRVRLELPLKNGGKEYFYQGTVDKEPLDAEKVKMAVFSCNADYGFPDSEVSLHALKHKPDLAVFLGDQFYESTGGFGIQTSPLEKSSLDYLRKWYMFGWSYREIFRNIPSAFIPDDHDVYHGNVWGESGKHAPTDQGWTYVAQDQGGYKMPPEWINMVQLTQTSHLPDPYDPTPVKQGIGTYYTDWVYGGISFAILEDRKFKSAPKNVLPEEAKVTNGFIQNPEFDIKKYYDVEAELLGDRQLKFLEDWSADWGRGVEMKAVLSQTNFCTVATLPEGSIIDSIVPKLPIPKLGEYVTGDAPTSDMDSNGWPQKGRDEALKIIRKSFALHVAGDQHLASVVHYGVDDFGDSGFAFAGPALNNLFPRRWWPTVEENHQPLPDQPKNTGNFMDGFGNKMTVHSVANPHQTGKEPALVYDRATGYGMVIFDKQERTMKIECWPRYIDPERNPDGQYQGWPITISQEDNYARKAVGYLATLEIEGGQDPVVQVINEDSKQVEYVMRIKGNSFRPKVFSPGKYTLKVSQPETGKEKTLTGLEIAKKEGESVILTV